MNLDGAVPGLEGMMLRRAYPLPPNLWNHQVSERKIPRKMQIPKSLEVKILRTKELGESQSGRRFRHDRAIGM